jgi:hypothetical protein
MDRKKQQQAQLFEVWGKVVCDLMRCEARVLERPILGSTNRYGKPISDRAAVTGRGQRVGHAQRAQFPFAAIAAFRDSHGQHMLPIAFSQPDQGRLRALDP